MAEACRILVMASGNGSNFQALCDAVAGGQIPNSSIIRLIVNRRKAHATKRAEQNGIPWDYFNLISHGFQAKSENDPKRLQEARDEYDAALAGKVLNSDPRPHLIVLAGWMHIFGEHFLSPLEAEGIKIINLHPRYQVGSNNLKILPMKLLTAYLGKYDGACSIERAFDDFQAGNLENNKTGIMVHHVIKQVDQGEVIMTREVECHKGEDLQQLRERMQSHEHKLIVEATAHVVRETLANRQ